MLVPMVKVELIGPRPLLDDVVSALHETGLVHIEDLTARIEEGKIPVERMRISSQDEMALQRLTELLATALSVVRALGLAESPRSASAGTGQPTSAGPGAGVRSHAGSDVGAVEGDDRLAEEAATVAELLERLEPVVERARQEASGAVTKLADLEAESVLLARYEPMLRKVGPLASQIATTEGFDSLALLVERRLRTVPDEIRSAMDDLTNGQCEVLSAEADEDTTALVVIFPRKYSDTVHRLLESENVSQVRLPSEFGTVPFDTAYRSFQQRRAEMPARIKAASEVIAVLRDRWGARLFRVCDALTDAIDEITATTRFGSTRYAFIITGWLPSESVVTLRNALGARFSGQVGLFKIPIEEDSRAEVPVALKNPEYAQPFEQLLKSLGGGRPRYGTIDPTMLVAIGYPLIFGMIVGDVGYGLAMLAIALVLRARWRDRPGVQLATSVVLPATISAIAFGLVYGEVFGDLPIRAGLLDPETGRGFVDLLGVRLPYIRSHDIMPMVYAALAFGVVHVTLGLVLGMVNAVKTGDRKHARAKAGLLGFVVGVFILGAATLFGIREAAPVVRIVGASVMAASVFLTLRFGAAMGVVELIETVTGMASYIRIMAVGISGAIFADAVNALVSSVGIVIGIVAALFLHVLHLVLAAFTPTVHALRLNFLEFFGRFYQPGAVEYKPFRRSGGGKSQ